MFFKREADGEAEEMPTERVLESLAREVGTLLIESKFPEEEGISNLQIKETKLTQSDPIITIIRALVRDKKIRKNEEGQIVIDEDERIRKPSPKPNYQKGDPKTPATDKLESETVKHILEEETRHTKNVAIEVLTDALGLGRFARDNFQSKARFAQFKTVQDYLFETSHFWEVYHELVPKMDEQISMMGEALRNAEYRVNELLKENQQKEYLIREFKAMVEKRA